MIGQYTITDDSEIKTALVKFNYTEPSIDQLATHVGFSADELKMLSIFWKPAFNNEWIGLDRTMIKEWFCRNDKTKKAVNNFYTRILLKYELGVDYKEISSDSPLTVRCQSCSSDLNTKNKDTRGGYNAKYYAVTGDCFKMIGMVRNKDIRRYYIKVEKLAAFMTKYISAMQTYIYTNELAKQKSLTDKISEKVKNMQIINDRIQTHINNTKVLEKTSTFYIATSKRYAEQNIFKPGCIDSIGEKQLKQRLAQYNTGKTGDDLFYFCHVEQVYDARELDHKIKKIFSDFKYNKRKEMIICWWPNFINIVKHISENHTEDYDFFNDFISDGRYKMTLNEKVVVPPNVVGDTVTIAENKNGVGLHIVDVDNLTDEQKVQYLIRAIEIFCKNNGIAYDHKKDKDSDKQITIIWDDMKSILKKLTGVQKLMPSKWRGVLKSISESTKSIDHIKWCKK